MYYIFYVWPNFMASSVAVSEAATWVKSMYKTKSWFKTRKKR